jgi:SAM-dependent methyltransferase
MAWDAALVSTQTDYPSGGTMRLRQQIYGVAVLAPRVNKFFAAGTGGTISARYCYSVWLRHLVMASQSGLNTNPKAVAELGPGDSLGIGLAALVSGCDQYFALDVVEYANLERNTKIFDELVELFRSRAPIPAGDEFSEVKPYLDDYSFPAKILDEARLDRALETSRLERIRRSITDVQSKESLIQYRAPWLDADVLEKASVDMVYSQAVLEHVDDLEGAYSAMYSWLRPSGYISHQIDFRCHGTARGWNGQWLYPALVWRVMRRGRPYLLNRAPHSAHIELMTANGFEVVCDKTIRNTSGYKSDELARCFRQLSEDDLTTSGAFIQAVKRPEST